MCAHIARQPYLEHIMVLKSRAPEVIRTYLAEFEKGMTTELKEGSLQHAARNFGFVYAGGRLAIDAGVLPWNRKHLLAAILACFRASLREIGRHEDVATRARRILRQKLKGAALPLKGAKGVNPALHDGFRERANGKTTFTLKSTAMRSWFTDAAHFRAALLWLNGERVLVASHGGPRGSGTEWAATTPRWVGNKKVKSVRFRDPFRAKRKRS